MELKNNMLLVHEYIGRLMQEMKRKQKLTQLHVGIQYTTKRKFQLSGEKMNFITNDKAVMKQQWENKMNQIYFLQQTSGKFKLVQKMKFVS